MQYSISATRIAHNGAWEIAAIVNGYRQARVYYGYTRREAMRLFVVEMDRQATNV